MTSLFCQIFFSSASKVPLVPACFTQFMWCNYKKPQQYCDSNLASLIIMEQSFTHSFSQNISLSLFMHCPTEGSSHGTLLRCEDETKHQGLHSVSGSSGMTVLTHSSKHHSAPLTSDLNLNITWPGRAPKVPLMQEFTSRWLRMHFGSSGFHLRTVACWGLNHWDMQCLKRWWLLSKWLLSEITEV